jgi:hypothetical protein
VPFCGEPLNNKDPALNVTPGGSFSDNFVTVVLSGSVTVNFTETGVSSVAVMSLELRNAGKLFAPSTLPDSEYPPKDP